MEEKNIFIFFEKAFSKYCCFSDLEKQNGDDLIDEIIKSINNWIVQNSFKDINDQEFQVTRFNVNDMIKVRINGKYETNLFGLKSSNYLKVNESHEVEIVKITDSKIFIGNNCIFQKGDKNFSSYNYLIESSEFYIIAKWDGTPPKTSAMCSKDNKNTTKFIMVDIVEELINREFYNNQLISELNKVKDKEGRLYTYPESAERNNLYPNILTVECGSFRTTVNLVLYDKYKSTHEFDIDNIGFLKKNKDMIFSYQIDKLFPYDPYEIEKNINSLKEARKLCIDYLGNDTDDMESDLIEKLDLLSESINTNNLSICVAKKLDQITQKLSIEIKRKKLLRKFYNINQLYLCKVQNFQIPGLNFTGNRGNYIKPRVLEMMPLGFLSFSNDMN